MAAPRMVARTRVAKKQVTRQESRRIAAGRIDPANPPKERINVFFGVTAVVIALFLDGLQFLVSLIGSVFFGIGFVLSWLISAPAFLLYGFFFFMSGVRHFEGKQRLARLFGFLGSFAIEFLPLLNVLPSITIWVLTTVLTTMKEDRERLASWEEEVRKQGAARFQYPRVAHVEQEPDSEIHNKERLAA